jgi:GNAT superfamily N-acetyltransferase
MPKTILIRPLTPEDRTAWEHLFDLYAEFYKTQVPREAKDQVWAWIFDPEEDFWCDLAFRDGRAVGLVQYQLMHRSLSGAKVCYLSDLYVDPSLRGGGIGRALIDHVIGFAKARRISNVRWLTQDFNYAGRKLYDSYRPKSDFILYSVPVEL